METRRLRAALAGRTNGNAAVAAPSAARFKKRRRVDLFVSPVILRMAPVISSTQHAGDAPHLEMATHTTLLAHLANYVVLASGKPRQGANLPGSLLSG